TLFRDLLSFLIFFKDREELGSLTLGANLPLRLVCFCSPKRLFYLTAGLINEAFAVFASPYDLMEGIFNLFGRVNNLRLHLGDHQAGLIGIQELLQKLARLVLDLDTAHRQYFFDRGPANDTAESDFSRVAQALVGVRDPEQVLTGVFHPVLDNRR